MPRSPRRSAPKPSAYSCPKCADPLDRRDLSGPRQHRLAIPLYVGGALLSIAWAALLIRTGLVVVPRSLAGMAAVGLLYLAPGLALGWFAARLPRHGNARCDGCDWSGSLTLRT